MTTSFFYDQQVEELPEFWTDEMIQDYLQSEEEDLEDYYYQEDDDQALEHYSLCCAYGEEY